MTTPLSGEIRSLALSMQGYRKEAKEWYRWAMVATMLCALAVSIAGVLYLEVRATRAALSDCQAGFEVSPFYDLKEKP